MFYSRKPKECHQICLPLYVQILALDQKLRSSVFCLENIFFILFLRISNVSDFVSDWAIKSMKSKHPILKYVKEYSKSWIYWNRNWRRKKVLQNFFFSFTKKQWKLKRIIIKVPHVAMWKNVRIHSKQFLLLESLWSLRSTEFVFLEVNFEVPSNMEHSTL